MYLCIYLAITFLSLTPPHSVPLISLVTPGLVQHRPDHLLLTAELVYDGRNALQPC